MRVAIASDHGGFEPKQHVAASVRSLGHDPADLGTFDPAPADYPEQAERVGLEVHCGRASAMTPTPPTRAWSTTA